MACNPDHSDQLKRLNRIIGQLEGVKKMITEKTYCPKILIQTKAATSAIRSLETNLLEKHIEHCVTNAIATGVDANEKTQELISIFKTRIK
jgi:DNA-binding FrmR family transcriptional regulator